tara:strand:- start:1116 stop:1775 length:660 start_codon:yes stop_codon:yes gene_type:complete
MAKKQIFIVDDHAVVRYGLSALIGAQSDMEICGMAGSASEALDLVRKLKTMPDLVVSDLTLPDHNGLELIKDLKALDPKLPVLMMSMHDELLYAERVLKAGGRGYLMKEHSENVVPAIRQILRGTPYVSPAVTSHFLESLAGGESQHYSFPLKRLTDRELEVFELIGQGKATEHISTQLNISPRTVDAHRTHIREKLGLADSSAVLRYAVRWQAGEDLE